MRSFAFALALGLLGACGDDVVPPPRTLPLWSDGTHLRDTDGRIALLRGINARIDGVFDVTFADGRVPLEPIPPLTAVDCRRMRELGLDLLRLPINWSGIEPTRDAFDEAYLARVESAVRCAADAGMVVLIDLHQDAYSKEIGEDGAPLWAIVPAPEMLLEGPLDDLDIRRLSSQVTKAFTSFFDSTDAAGLQAEFFAMLDHVAARWADDPAVIGFELFNEPVASQDEVEAFSIAAAARVRAAAPDKLVVFEPSATRNLFDAVSPSRVPFPTTGAVYAPHIYTFVFYSDPTSLENLVPSDLEPSVASTRVEATAWETPIIIGEFGVGPNTPNADLWMGVQAELHDRYLVSDAFWVWKEDSQGSWGVYDRVPTVEKWAERPQVVGWISRIHAARIAGEVIENAFDRTTGALRLTTRGASKPHQIYIPERAALTFLVLCDDIPRKPPREAATGLISVVCDGQLLVKPS